ncbi:PTS glucose transporter subunit IIA, partial [Staphylococcus capitis]|uniref:PTS glucose transporter subunit IIA n=1 Tax=Staphylococcus capitis TaxID=29388 RepID=UPI003709C156
MIPHPLAFIPQKRQILPPFHPNLKTIFPTKHPIPLQSHTPLQVLIHIPIHTLKLNPHPFQTFLQPDQTLTQPQPLIKIHKK